MKYDIPASKLYDFLQSPRLAKNDEYGTYCLIGGCVTPSPEVLSGILTKMTANTTQGDIGRYSQAMAVPLIHVDSQRMSGKSWWRDDVVCSLN